MLTSNTLKDLLTNVGIPAKSHTWVLPDISYEPVTRQFVLNNWDAWLAARPPELLRVRQIGGGKTALEPLWERESGDCDNLALGTMVHAQVGNALAAVLRRKPRGGLAYGVLFYMAGPARPENYGIAGGHAINWQITPRDEVLFFEPAAGAFVTLSQQERSSAWFGLAA